MKKFISVIGVLITSACIFALDIPVLSAHVNDYAGVMKNADKRKAEEYLSALENTTGIQIAVLTIPSLEGESLESYSYNVAEKWQLGQNGKDNGALLLVAMKEKKVRIENGYGLEDTLTDTKSGLIIRNVILPEFRNGNYSEGILRGIQNMGGIASGNAELVSKSVSEPKNTSSGAESVLFGFLFVFGWFILFSCLASGRQNHWLPWIIFSSAFRHQHHTHGSGFSSGGMRNSGFGSSGGFHGGGGHFGGGGASGGW